MSRTNTNTRIETVQKTIYTVLASLYYYFNIPQISTNDYLNPFTLTFKNPKTVQMLNIIILYHYVMAFLLGIIVFTFIFIFLSFFRTYVFFYARPFFTHYERNDEKGQNVFFPVVFIHRLYVEYGK